MCIRDRGKRRARVRLRWAGAKAATRAIGRHAVAAANQFDVLADKLDAELAAAEAEAHAAATEESSSRPPAPTEDEAFAALADGVDDVDRDDSAVDEEFAALADGLGDVDESPPPPTEQAEFAALADGLGDGGE